MKTKITEMLGIKYPIFQGAMAHVSSTYHLQAAVSNTGGLGIFAVGSHLESKELKRQIQLIRISDPSGKMGGEGRTRWGRRLNHKGMESGGHVGYISKKAIMESHIEDTVITGNITGLRCRVLKNKLGEEMLKLEEKGASEEMSRFGSEKCIWPLWKAILINIIHWLTINKDDRCEAKDCSVSRRMNHNGRKA